MTGIKSKSTAVCADWYGRPEALPRGVFSPEDRRNQEDLFFHIPSRIILNERGISFFTSHQKALHHFETADGGRHFGFRMEKTIFSWLKKLILKNYLKKIEIQVKDISACRLQLEDAVKLVFFSMFRRRINASVLEYVYDSAVVRAWNRMNPKKSIGPGMRMAEESFRELLNSRISGRLEELRAELYDKIVQNLSPSLAGRREDSVDVHNFIAELVFHINPLVLFVLAGSKEEDKFTLFQNISRGISEFIRRLDTVNLAAFLTVELVSAAERSALVRLLEHRGDMPDILENPDKRKSLMAEKQFRGSTVTASVPEEVSRESRRVRFRISVYNDGAEAGSERRLMEDFTEHGFIFKDGMDIGECLKSSRSRRESGLDVYENNGLCFYHLAELREQCRKNNILLDVSVKNAHSGKAAVTTLWFGF
ncbi:MAG: hypothetical protein LBI67_12760 [Treponema sp.]|jgi:hypothetical protein|nr:hypothetical protein [Treponema sp.]